MVKSIKHLLLQHPALLLGMYSIEILVLPRLFNDDLGLILTFLQQVQQLKNGHSQDSMESFKELA